MLAEKPVTIGQAFGGGVVAIFLLIVPMPVAMLMGLFILILAADKIAEEVMRNKATGKPNPEKTNALAKFATKLTAIREDAEENQRAEFKKFRKHIDIGNAAIDVWFHPDEGLAKRVVRIRDKALAEKFGEKLNLEEIEVVNFDEVDGIVEQTVREVKEKFSIGDTAKAVTTPPRERKSTRTKAKAATSYTGEIIRFGMETREGKEGKYDTFALHLFDDQAGAPHELCGTDLQRAIKEAGVQPGDTVKVESLGRTQVPLGNGRTGFKNLWSVSKV